MPRSKQGRKRPSIQVPSDSSDDDDDEFEQEMLFWHNVYRMKDGLNPVKLRRELCSMAKQWATTMVLDNRFEPMPSNAYGENLYMRRMKSRDDRVKAKTVVEFWYNTKGCYSRAEPWRAESAPYTQVLWRDTSVIGCGKRRNCSYKVIGVACYYFPKGNIVGQYVANLPYTIVKRKEIDRVALAKVMGLPPPKTGTTKAVGPAFLMQKKILIPKQMAEDQIAHAEVENRDEEDREQLANVGSPSEVVDPIDDRPIAPNKSAPWLRARTEQEIDAEEETTKPSNLAKKGGRLRQTKSQVINYPTTEEIFAQSDGNQYKDMSHLLNDSTETDLSNKPTTSRAVLAQDQIREKKQVPSRSQANVKLSDDKVAKTTSFTGKEPAKKKKSAPSGHRLESRSEIIAQPTHLEMEADSHDTADLETIRPARGKSSFVADEKRYTGVRSNLSGATLDDSDLVQSRPFNSSYPELNENTNRDRNEAIANEGNAPRIRSAHRTRASLDEEVISIKKSSRINKMEDTSTVKSAYPSHMSIRPSSTSRAKLDKDEVAHRNPGSSHQVRSASGNLSRTQFFHSSGPPVRTESFHRIQSTHYLKSLDEIAHRAGFTSKSTSRQRLANQFSHHDSQEQNTSSRFSRPGGTTEGVSSASQHSSRPSLTSDSATKNQQSHARTPQNQSGFPLFPADINSLPTSINLSSKSVHKDHLPDSQSTRQSLEHFNETAQAFLPRAAENFSNTRIAHQSSATFPLKCLSRSRSVLSPYAFENTDTLPLALAERSSRNALGCELSAHLSHRTQFSTVRDKMIDERDSSAGGSAQMSRAAIGTELGLLSHHRMSVSAHAAPVVDPDANRMPTASATPSTAKKLAEATETEL